MRIYDYLQKKYGTDGLTISAEEAKAFGIDWPLITGWLDRHGDEEIMPQAAAGLLPEMLGRAERFSCRADCARRGADILRGIAS